MVTPADVPGHSSRPGQRHLSLLLGGLFLFGYVGLAFGLEDTYPFYRFDMFSWPMRAPVGRVFVQLPDGHFEKVQAYTEWACADPLGYARTDVEACDPFIVGDRFERQVERHLVEHASASTAPAADAVVVSLVRRVVRPGPDGAPETLACELTECSAVPLAAR